MCMEAHTMINSEHPSGAGENVASLAIGIVDQDVEDGEQPEVSNIGVDHRHRAIVRIKAFHGGANQPCLGTAELGTRSTSWLVAASSTTPRPEEIRPERPVGQHRDRHAVEAADRDTSYAATSSQGAARNPRATLPSSGL